MLLRNQQTIKIGIHRFKLTVLHVGCLVWISELLEIAWLRAFWFNSSQVIF